MTDETNKDFKTPESNTNVEKGVEDKGQNEDVKHGGNVSFHVTKQSCNNNDSNKSKMLNIETKLSPLEPKLVNMKHNHL